jgi:RNA polymerase sigma-70 factor (ECF subfamily)
MEATPLTDKAALRAIRRRDADALARIIDRYAAYVGTVIWNIIGDRMTREDIEETASDVFVALWENAEKAKAGKLKSYLGGIARNKAKNKLRELKAALPLEDDYIIVDDNDSPEDTLTEYEERQAVYQAVLEMPSSERDVFLRHYYFCQPVSRIAEEMGLNASTVKMRLARGREKLRAKLSKEANA